MAYPEPTCANFDVNKTSQTSVSKYRTSAFPLDYLTYFESYTEAANYVSTAKQVGDTTVNHYIGEIVTVVENNEVGIYKVVKDFDWKITTFADHTNDVTINSFTPSGTYCTIVATQGGTTTTAVYNAAQTTFVPPKGIAPTSPITVDYTANTVEGALGSSVSKSYKNNCVLEEIGSGGGSSSGGGDASSILNQAKQYTDDQIDLHKGDILANLPTPVANSFVRTVTQNGDELSVSYESISNADLPDDIPVTKLALGSGGQKISADLLPSYVDDVIELENMTGTQPSSPVKGTAYYNQTSKKVFTYTGSAWTSTDPETGKIYLDKSTNKGYRWGGTAFVVVSSDLTLGETDSTAYRGDRGKIAYDHAVSGNGGETPSRTALTTAAVAKITTNASGHVVTAVAAELSDWPELKHELESLREEKANKVYNATVNKLAKLTADGNLAQDGYTSDELIEAVTKDLDFYNGSTKVTTYDGKAAKKIVSGENVQIALSGSDIKISATDTIYTHPAYDAADPAAKKIGRDATGHVVIGGDLTPTDVGLGKSLTFKNGSTTLSPAFDGSANVNVSINTENLTATTNTTTNTITIKHKDDRTPVTAAAVKVGMDKYGHTMIGNALAPSDLGLGYNLEFYANGQSTALANKYNGTAVRKIKAGTNVEIAVSGTDGVVISNTYTHPTYTSKTSAAYKITVDSTGHVSGTAALDKLTFVDGATSGQYDSNTALNIYAGDNVTFADISGSGSDTRKGIQINAAKYAHPAYDQEEAAAVKVGRDATGHVVLGDALSKSDVGLNNVNNTNITVSATDGVKDNTNNVTYKYTHPTHTSKTSGAYKITVDGLGHVSATSALTKSDLGLGNVNNTSITVDPTDGVKDNTNNKTYKYTHPTTTAANPAAKKIGKDSSGHVVIGDALKIADLDLSVKDTAGTGINTNGHFTLTGADESVVTFAYDASSSAFKLSIKDATASTHGLMTSAMVTKLSGIETGANKYVHPAYAAANIDAVKVGRDATGHVLIGGSIYDADIYIGTHYFEVLSNDAVTADNLFNYVDEALSDLKTNKLNKSVLANKSNTNKFVQKFDDSGAPVFKQIAEADLTTELQNKIAAVSGVVHFRGAVNSLPAVSNYKVAGYEKGDLVIIASGNTGAGKEYILTGEGTQASPHVWQEVGDETAMGQLAESVADHETRIGSLETSVANHESTITDHTSKISALTTRVNTLSLSVVDHETKINNLDAEFDDLSAAVADHETRIRTNEESIAELESDAEWFEASVADHETRIGSIEENENRWNQAYENRVVSVVKSGNNINVSTYTAGKLSTKTIDLDVTYVTHTELGTSLSIYATKSELGDLGDLVESYNTKLDARLDIVESAILEDIDGRLDAVESLADNNQQRIGALEGDYISSVKVNGTALTKTSNAVNIPIASTSTLGVVKAGTGANTIAVNSTSGVMTVNSVSTDKLVDPTSGVLILNGGSAST